jgi:hypothetical protein
MFRLLVAFTLLLSVLAAPARGQMAGVAGSSELMVADGAVARAVIVVAADAGPLERRAADDLRKYIRMMTGASPEVRSQVPLRGAALVVGKAALASDPATARALARVAKAKPVIQADAISVRRVGERVFIAGANEVSHYFAVTWLLQQWGCRWYMPTEFGEVVPRHKRLSVGALAFSYAPPFEIRRYWTSWNGSVAGQDDFRRRNFMSDATMPGSGHALDQYTADLAPRGGTHFNVPFADPRTAAHVAGKIEADYAAGKDISLAIADGNYVNDHPADRALSGGYDRYMLKPSMTDAMMTFYNNVASVLRRKYPASPSKIGGMAYVNVTLPPRTVRAVQPNLVMWLAPIDIDPNHAMDDPRSPPRLEYRDMVAGWSELMGGRLGIYDYDQGMLVWRDLPNPSHHVFARDAKIYRELGILGIQTESRGAFATTFLNLFFRGQLMWNPDANVGALLREFYPNFYGPAAAPMARYWGRIFKAWELTGVTEHEHLAAPAIYTPALVEKLRPDLAAAEAALAVAPAGDNKLYAERLRFTRASFETIASYVEAVRAAATEADYASAATAGEKALAARAALAGLNPLFTTGGDEPGAAWLPGEVAQYRDYRALTDGSKGRLVARLPLEWRFKVEQPLSPAFRYAGPQGARASGDGRLASEDMAGGWRAVRSDVYLQGQGVLAADGQAHLGHYWYRSAIHLKPGEAHGPVRLMFPGVFNEAWLYVNGKVVGHRAASEPWWLTDYRFEWDVDLKGHLKPGRNDIALRGFNPHHFGGMFRRPFLYRPN